MPAAIFHPLEMGQNTGLEEVSPSRKSLCTQPLKWKGNYPFVEASRE